MSWNPRRFAIAAAERPATRDAVAMWLTSAAVTRLASALLHETLDFSTAPPFPAEGVVLGLECPLGTAAGERAAMVYTRVEGLPAADGPMHTDKVMATPTVANLGRLENPQEWADFLGHSSHGISHIAMDRRGVTIDTQLEVIFQSPSGDAISLSDGTSALCGLFADGFGEGKWLRDGLTPAERALIRFCAHAAWVLLHEPVEREVSAITLSPTPIRTGKGRRGRDMSVSVIDVRRSTTTRSAPSGRVIEHDHRWTRRGHWRMQPFGKGRSGRRKVWIDETVCGPADKPLLQRPKVQVLR